MMGGRGGEGGGVTSMHPRVYHGAQGWGASQHSVIQAHHRCAPTQHYLTHPFAHRSKMAPAKREPFNARKGGDIMPRGVFDDGTTYRTGFVPKEVGVPAQFRPRDAGALHTGDFEGNTEYRNQFIDKEVPGAARGGGQAPGAEWGEERYWKRLNQGVARFCQKVRLAEGWKAGGKIWRTHEQS